MIIGVDFELKVNSPTASGSSNPEGTVGPSDRRPSGLFFSFFCTSFRQSLFSFHLLPLCLVSILLFPCASVRENTLVVPFFPRLILSLPILLAGLDLLKTSLLTTLCNYSSF